MCSTPTSTWYITTLLGSPTLCSARTRPWLVATRLYFTRSTLTPPNCATLHPTKRASRSEAASSAPVAAAHSLALSFSLSLSLACSRLLAFYSLAVPPTLSFWPCCSHVLHTPPFLSLQRPSSSIPTCAHTLSFALCYGCVMCAAGAS